MYKNYALSITILFLTHNLSASGVNTNNNGDQNLVFDTTTTNFFASYQAALIKHLNNQHTTDENPTDEKPTHSFLNFKKTSSYPSQQRCSTNPLMDALLSVTKKTHAKTEEKFCQTEPASDPRV